MCIRIVKKPDHPIIVINAFHVDFRVCVSIISFSIYYQRFIDDDFGRGYEVDTNGHRVKIQKYNELWC